MGEGVDSNTLNDFILIENIGKFETRGDFIFYTFI